jgi:hypothetical protein
MVAIRKEMEIAFGQPWADEVMRLPSNGLLFKRISPVNYLLREDWPGMFFVFLQARAWASEYQNVRGLKCVLL